MSEPFIKVNGIEIDLDAALQSWSAPLEKIFPTQTVRYRENPRLMLLKVRSQVKPRLKIAKPRVFLPVFPGTNCEYDTSRAFSRAGAVVEPLVFRNLSPEAVEDSIQQMVKGINNSQIIILPGGFSAGDEPDGSGKFIATAFRNPLVKEAVMKLLQERDGLILGICNGFQALIKLGLVPYGEIREITRIARP